MSLSDEKQIKEGSLLNWYSELAIKKTIKELKELIFKNNSVCWTDIDKIFGEELTK